MKMHKIKVSLKVSVVHNQSHLMSRKKTDYKSKIVFKSYKYQQPIVYIIHQQI